MNRIKIRETSVLFLLSLCFAMTSIDNCQKKGNQPSPEGRSETTSGFYTEADLSGLKTYLGRWDAYKAKDLLARIGGKDARRKTSHGGVRLIVPVNVRVMDSDGKTLQEDLELSIENTNTITGKLKAVWDDFFLPHAKRKIKKAMAKNKGVHNQAHIGLFVVLCYMELTEKMNKVLDSGTGTSKQEVINKLRKALTDFEFKISENVGLSATGVELVISDTPGGSDQGTDQDNEKAVNPPRFVKLTVKSEKSILTDAYMQKVNAICTDIKAKIDELESKK